MSLKRQKLQSSNFVHGFATISRSTNIQMIKCSLSGRGQGHVTHSRYIHIPWNISGTAENFVKFCAQVGPRSISLAITNCPQAGVVKVTWRLNFLANKCFLICRKRCKTEIYLQWKTNRESYMAYQMAATAVTLNDLEGHSPVAGLFKCNTSNICAVFYMISIDSVFAVHLH